MLKSVLFILDSLSGGGAEKMTMRVASSLSNMGYNVFVIVLLGGTEHENVPDSVKRVYLSEYFDVSGIGYFSANESVKRYADQVNRIILEERIECVVSTWWYSVLMSRYLNSCNKAVWLHSNILLGVPYSEGFPQAILRIFKYLLVVYYNFRRVKLIFLDHDQADYFPYRMPFLKKAVIPNGIKVEPVRVVKKNYDIAFIGRLSKEKKPADALLAFLKSGLKGRMVFVGDGPERPDLIDICKKFSAVDRVVFVGWTDCAYKYMAESKMVVISSLRETFSLVALESLMIGTPIVAYDCSPFIRFLLTSMSQKKYLFSVGDVDGLAGGIKELAFNPYSINRSLIEGYSLDAVTNSFKKFLNL